MLMQQSMELERDKLEDRIKLINGKHLEEMSGLHGQLEKAYKEIDVARETNNELRRQTVDHLQTLLDEMHNLEERNNVLNQQLRDIQEEKKVRFVRSNIIESCSFFLTCCRFSQQWTGKSLPPGILISYHYFCT
jgi:peptidoglycan hydrolase CwlO-like protein